MDALEERYSHHEDREGDEGFGFFYFKLRGQIWLLVTPQ
jgi:hypothetical protein